jgi:hypothetical protein
MDKTLISGLNKGMGGSRPGRRRISAGHQFLKIESFFFSFFLQKPKKFKKNQKIDYISAARRVNPPRPGVYFWTSFCPELVKFGLLAMVMVTRLHLSSMFLKI